MSESTLAGVARTEIIKAMLDEDPELRSWAHYYLEGKTQATDAGKEVLKKLLDEFPKLLAFVRAYLKVYP
jgi:hypothetical protein